jgi:PAS domain S-box-containing protein
LSDFIREHAASILVSWETAVRSLRPARHLDQLALVDHLPEFLTALSQYVDEVRAGRLSVPDVSLPSTHALERLELGYDLQDVVEEYGVLRRCIVELFVSTGSDAMRSAEMPRLHFALDQAVAVAVERYVHARDRTLIALDRLTTASLGHEDVGAFLGEVLHILLDTTASVDAAEVLLKEDGVLRVRATIGAAAEGNEGTTVRIGECFAGRIAATGQPLSTRDAANDPSLTTSSAPRAGIRALYGAPLMVENELIGVALMGSARTHEFSNEDKLLFRATVTRAATLIFQAELRRREREQRKLYETLLDAQSTLGIGVFICQGDKLLFANEAMAKMTGLSVPALLAKPAPEFDGSDHFRSGLRRSDGTELLVEVAKHELPDGRVVTIVRDITASVLAAEQLRDSEDRLRLALEAAAIGTWDYHPQAGDLRWDSRCRQIMGVPLDQAVTYQDFVDAIHPEERAKVDAVVKSCLDPRSHREYDLHFRIVRKNGGEQRWVHTRGSVFFQGGVAQRFVGTMIDVTGPKEQQEELARSVSFRDQILAILGHDLRNPLGAILLTSSLLLRRGGLSEKLQTDIGRIDQATRRMSGMISDLLDFAQSRFRGVMPIACARTDLLSIARRVLDELSVANPQRELVLDSAGDLDGLWDANRLGQLLSNLVGNAVQYGRAGTPVTVRLDGGAAEHVLLRVHNLGAPIPREVLPGIFEPFRRGTWSAAKPGNLGLGLYIARQIAIAHGGTLEVTSTERNGTAFVARLPRG